MEYNATYSSLSLELVHIVLPWTVNAMTVEKASQLRLVNHKNHHNRSFLPTLTYLQLYDIAIPGVAGLHVANYFSGQQAKSLVGVSLVVIFRHLSRMHTAQLSDVPNSLYPCPPTCAIPTSTVS
jgi:hypothetical protein